MQNRWQGRLEGRTICRSQLPPDLSPSNYAQHSLTVWSAISGSNRRHRLPACSAFLAKHSAAGEQDTCSPTKNHSRFLPSRFKQAPLPLQTPQQACTHISTCTVMYQPGISLSDYGNTVGQQMPSTVIAMLFKLERLANLQAGVKLTHACPNVYTHLVCTALILLPSNK